MRITRTLANTTKNHSRRSKLNSRKIKEEINSTHTNKILNISKSDLQFQFSSFYSLILPPKSHININTILTTFYSSKILLITFLETHKTQLDSTGYKHLLTIIKTHSKLTPT